MQENWLPSYLLLGVSSAETFFHTLAVVTAENKYIYARTGSML